MRSAKSILRTKRTKAALKRAAFLLTLLQFIHFICNIYLTIPKVQYILNIERRNAREKSENEIQAITGATITSNAVKRCVNAAIEILNAETAGEN